MQPEEATAAEVLAFGRAGMAAFAQKAEEIAKAVAGHYWPKGPVLPQPGAIMQLKGATDLEERCSAACYLLEEMPASPVQTKLVLTMSDAGNELQRLRHALATSQKAADKVVLAVGDYVVVVCCARVMRVEGINCNAVTCSWLREGYNPQDIRYSVDFNIDELRKLVPCRTI